MESKPVALPLVSSSPGLLVARIGLPKVFILATTSATIHHFLEPRLFGMKRRLAIAQVGPKQNKAQPTKTLPSSPVQGCDGTLFRPRQASRRSSLHSLPNPNLPPLHCRSHSMKATTTVTPAPAELSSPKSGATKRPRKAVALSDVTNLLLPETPTKPRISGRRSTSGNASTCSSSSSASVTPAPKRSSAAVLDEECSVVKSPAISTVYARRGASRAEASGKKGGPTTTKSKGKEPAAAAAAGTSSCPQLGKSTRNGNRETSAAQGTRPISYSAPCHEAKKKRLLSSTQKLPEDFVKKQRAYFAAVDAFELPEEEVWETDLD